MEARALQDPLSFRTLAQLNGATRDALGFVRSQLEIELNAAQSNPLVLAGEERLISVGNFELQPLATALDLARIALAPALSTAAERAVKLLQAPLTGLTEGLGARPGLAESALSELGIAVQAFASEARLLAQPVSLELVSTTQAEGIEDRMTMAPLAARRLAEMVQLGARVVSIELMLAAQACDLRDAPLAPGTAAVRASVRAIVPLRRGRGSAPRPAAARRPDQRRRVELTAVDIHQHLWPPAFIEALSARSEAPRLADEMLHLAEGSYPFALGDHELRNRLGSLDEHGIGTAVGVAPAHARPGPDRPGRPRRPRRRLGGRNSRGCRLDDPHRAARSRPASRRLRGHLRRRKACARAGRPPPVARHAGRAGRVSVRPS